MWSDSVVRCQNVRAFRGRNFRKAFLSEYFEGIANVTVNRTVDSNEAKQASQRSSIRPPSSLWVNVDVFKFEAERVVLQAKSNTTNATMIPWRMDNKSRPAPEPGLADDAGTVACSP